MIFNLIVVAIVISLTAVWMFRGAFNSFIHFLCVLAAGAIAFAFWEKLAMFLVGLSPERGFLSFLEGIAWGVTLLVPFIVTLILLRVITDKIITSNIKSYGIVDKVFGLLFGLSIATTTAGILVIAIGTMRLSSDFLGYQPIWYSDDRALGQGSLVTTDRLWIPVDLGVSMIYGGYSQGTMSTNEPLAKWYPDLHLAGFANRISAGEGGARTAYTDDTFQLAASYIVGTKDGEGIKVKDLLKDERDKIPQKYIDINNQPVSKGYLAGYVIDFKPNARERGEKGGQVMVSNGQIRMVAQGEDGTTITIHPLATISESASGEYGRWRFDSNDVFINSVGGKTKVAMGFEFLVPAGYTPIGLYVKGVRVNLEGAAEPTKLTTVADRDRRIRSGSLIKGKAGATKQTFNLKNVAVLDGSSKVEGVHIGASIGVMMSTTAAKSAGLTLGDGNLVADGEGKLDPETQLGRKNTPTDRRLRVDRFVVGSGQQLVQIDVSPDKPGSMLGDAARLAPTDKPIKLVDTNGDEYEAIGYIYEDDTLMHIRYTLGSTLSGLNDVPELSKSRIGDQKLKILFIVSSNVDIEYFVIGDDAILQFAPPLPAKE